jgi:hypothetical protein
MEVFGATRERFFKSEGPITVGRGEFGENPFQERSRAYIDKDGIAPPDLEDMVIIRREARPAPHSSKRRRQPLGQAPNVDTNSLSILKSGGEWKPKKKKEFHVSFSPDVIAGTLREQRNSKAEKPSQDLKSQNRVLMQDLGANCMALANLKKELQMATAQIQRQEGEIMTLRQKLRECEREKEKALKLMQSRGFGKEAMAVDFRNPKSGSRSDDDCLRDQKIAAQEAQIKQLEAERSMLRDMLVQRGINSDFARQMRQVDDPRRCRQSTSNARFIRYGRMVPSDSDWG